MTIEWVNHIGAAAALKLMGHDIVDMRINPSNPIRTQTQFGFTPAATFAEDLQSYFDGKVTVDAMLFYNAINELRKKRFDLESMEKAKWPQQQENLTNLQH